MSCLSDLIITIHPSPKYRRLAWVLTGCALVSLYVAPVPCFLALLLTMVMVWALWQITRCPMPHPGLQSIAFQQKKWAIYVGGKRWVYEQMHICLDASLFLLLHFSGSEPSTQRLLVLFYDQLSHEELRRLNIIHTTTPSKKKPS
ncbi:MAG: hypothetical protein NTU48_01680 [Legionellales bacterium]|nr:hypothetical protein [Legionellales bacterium]